MVVAAAAEVDGGAEIHFPNEITPELLSTVPWSALVDESQREEEELTTLTYSGTKSDFLRAFFLEEDSMQYALSDVGEEIVQAPVWKKVEIPANGIQTPASQITSSPQGTWAKFIRYFHPRDGPEFIFGKAPGWHCTQMHMIGVPQRTAGSSSKGGNGAPDDNLFVFIDLSPIPLCSGVNYILRFNMRENNLLQQELSSGSAASAAPGTSTTSQQTTTDISVHLSVFTPKTMYSSFIRKGVSKDVGTLVQKWKARVSSAFSDSSHSIAAASPKLEAAANQGKKAANKSGKKFAPIDIRSSTPPTFQKP